MRVHRLKSWPGPFEAVRDGRKRAEVRVDDRGFRVGDELFLMEWLPKPLDGPPRYTGETERVAVTHILELDNTALWGPAHSNDRRVVLSLKRIDDQARAAEEE